jgi:hypothetical protein
VLPIRTAVDNQRFWMQMEILDVYVGLAFDLSIGINLFIKLAFFLLGILKWQYMVKLKKRI